MPNHRKPAPVRKEKLDLEVLRKFVALSGKLKNYSDKKLAEILLACGINPHRDGRPGLEYAAGFLHRKVGRILELGANPNSGSEYLTAREWRQIQIVVKKLEPLS